MGIANRVVHTDLEILAEMALEMCSAPNTHFFNPKSDLFFDERKYLTFKYTLAEFSDSVFDDSNTKSLRVKLLYDLGRIYWDELEDEKNKDYAQEMFNVGLNYLNESFDISKRLVTNSKYEKVKEDYNTAALISYDLSVVYTGEKKEYLLNFATSMCFESFNLGKPISCDYMVLANIYWERAKFANINDKESFYDLARLNYEKALATKKRVNKDYLFAYGLLLGEYSEEILSYQKQEDIKQEAVNVFLYYDKITGKNEGAKAINDLLGNADY